jgi:hypothetical protein
MAAENVGRVIVELRVKSASLDVELESTGLGIEADRYNPAVCLRVDSMVIWSTSQSAATLVSPVRYDANAGGERAASSVRAAVCVIAATRDGLSISASTESRADRLSSALPVGFGTVPDADSGAV